jgi:sortase (surface protein transpeptidase)
MVQGIFLFAVGFFRTLVVIIVVLWVFRIIGRYVMPLVMKGFVNKMQQKMQDQMNQQQRPQRNEGDVTVEFDGKKKKKSAGSEKGEYVDFEEVD